MFVSQAHSFRQQAKLAITLAWIAGYTNILSVLACGTVTSHVSGTVSSLGRDVFKGSWGPTGYALFLLATFGLGAAASGFCTELGRRRGWDSIYVLPIVVETALLCVFAVAIELQGDHAVEPNLLHWMTGVAAVAMGLQNATITRISNGVVRTTHVTGVLTDLGHEAVQFLWWLSDRRRNVPPGSATALVHSVYTHPTAHRLALLGAILGMFALGAGLGTLAYDHTPRWAMFPPVAFLLWLVYQDLARPIAEIEPSQLLAAEHGLGLPSSLAVFHLRRKGRGRRGQVHRMPNLMAWAERLPETTRIVILDLGEVERVDANAALELRAVVAHLAAQGRELIVTGVDHEHLDRLRGVGDHLIHPDNLCPDLDLAIARAINLVSDPHA